MFINTSIRSIVEKSQYKDQIYTDPCVTTLCYREFTFKTSIKIKGQPKDPQQELINR